MFLHCQMSSLSLKNPECNLHFAVWHHLSLSGGRCTWLRRWSPQSHLTGHPPKGGHMLPVFAPGKILFCRYKMKMENFFHVNPPLQRPQTQQVVATPTSPGPGRLRQEDVECKSITASLSGHGNSWQWASGDYHCTHALISAPAPTRWRSISSQIIQGPESWWLGGCLHPGFRFCKAIPDLPWTLGAHHVLCPPNHPT